MADSAAVDIAATSLEDIGKALDQGPDRFFAILDACDEPKVPTKAADLGERAVSLYRGWAQEEHWAIAPYLVQLDNTLLEWIATDLWNASWGILVRSPVDLEGLRKHFRRFLIVEVPGGETVYFRFYDPRVLPVFLAACDAREAEAVFGPVRSFAFMDSDNRLVTATRARPTAWPQSGDTSSTASPDPLGRTKRWRMRPEHLEAFVAFVMAGFVRRALEHLQSELPDVWEKMPQPEAEAAVRRGVEQARRHGFEREPEVLRFLEVMTFLGPQVGDSPEHWVAMQMLRDERIVGDWPTTRNLVVSTAESRP